MFIQTFSVNPGNQDGLDENSIKDIKTFAMGEGTTNSPNRVNYYALMAICDVARKKYGTPVWSEQNEKY
ncbi:hypothetical protein [Bariatricus sp. SGI.019]|uniref:hypothetical protein n=1 Tax=Bariatricus sp. SGI.019 TaxID=3420548 RepID=UPI003CFE9564